MSLIKKNILAFCCLFSMSAQAGNWEIDPIGYSSVGIGYYSLDAGNGSSWVLAGFGKLGVDLNSYLALETRIGSTGATKKTTSFGNTRADFFITYFMKPQIDITRELRLYGVLGGTVMNSSYHAAGVARMSRSSNSASFGLGLDYHFTDRAAFALDWVRYSAKKDQASLQKGIFKGIDMSGFSSSLTWSF